MEQEFYRDEFEQFLKDTTDDFKMYPSRKVWHSIYNDLHPDRKWPSFAVCLLLLTGILYVGVSNNNAINSKSRSKVNYTSMVSSHAPDKNVEEDNTTHKSTSLNAPLASTGKAMQARNDIYALNAPDVTKLPYPVNDISNAGASPENTLAKNQQSKSSTVIAEKAFTVVNTTAVQPEALSEPGETMTNEAEEAGVSDVVSEGNNEGRIAHAAATFNAMQPVQPADHREWMDNFTFYNKKKERSIFKGGWSTQFYVAPSVGYRVLFRNEKYTAASENALIAANEAESVTGAEPNEQGALNIEAGAGIIKEISPRFRLKTGLQFNYTDFITNAQRLAHPTTTTVAINSAYGVTMEGYSTSYANTPGKNKDQLHNRTLQLSIPLGLDYKLMGNKRVAWYAGASFQPTYIAGGYAWAQSADNNFYVEDASLLRRWNFNAGFESFVSFRTPGGASINIGPQFRYQLMSTYTKKYTYTEKPYNIGFKIGLSKPL